MQDGYSLNVSKISGPGWDSRPERKTFAYSHFCRIAISDGWDREAACAKARDIAARFPESEGFKVELTEWRSSGRSVDFSEEAAKA